MKTENINEREHIQQNNEWDIIIVNNEINGKLKITQAGHTITVEKNSSKQLLNYLTAWDAQL